MALENKKELYETALKDIRERLSKMDVQDIIPRMATVSAILKNTLPYYFWCGFYFAEEEDMVVGPYQGTVACAHIGYGGVCGEGTKTKKTVIVPNVHERSGHIPCDPASNAEIVVPLIKDGETIAVFDVDSTEFNAFDETDKEYLESIMELIVA
ncbi:hypothetical protein COV18_02595 [Candidatus Woesearchaeota archaeon CG10_big_fil_rev_8_21_14_0_10_37_12]|nr:MAG: hypothetical protein COV18_02595 [Candidatus Woesearchaeota archaeon CG10_big_fil_rev_8_21_14_0_10_37_12]